MDSKAVEINCWCYLFDFISLNHHLSNFDEYKCTKLEDDLIVELKIDGESIRINLTDGRMDAIHVCLIGCQMDSSNKFNYDAKLPVQYYKEHFPTASIFIVCYDIEWKYLPDKLKRAELEGDNLMSREIGDKLAREIGAVKYIEYSNEIGRGVKILIDEIAFTGISKIKHDKKQREKSICNLL